MGLLRASVPTRSIKTRSRELASYADVGRGCICQASMSKSELFLGVDGGGTRCRARLCDASLLKLAEAQAGPANIRLGLKEAFASVLDVTLKCLEQAHLSSQDLPRITACLALAGATEPADLAAATLYKQSFGRAILTSDAHAACVGAHDGRDGAVVIVGTGS